MLVLGICMVIVAAAVVVYLRDRSAEVFLLVALLTGVGVFLIARNRGSSNAAIPTTTTTVYVSPWQAALDACADGSWVDCDWLYAHSDGNHDLAVLGGTCGGHIRWDDSPFGVGGPRVLPSKDGLWALCQNMAEAGLMIPWEVSAGIQSVGDDS